MADTWVRNTREVEDTRLAAQGNEVLHALHADLTKLAVGTLTDQAFARRWPLPQNGAWRRLQSLLPPDSARVRELSYLLAFHAVDYPANAARWLHLPARTPFGLPQTLAGWDESETDTRLPALLVILYRRHRDPDLLYYLLDNPCLEASALLRQARRRALAALWDHHHPALLQAIDANVLRRRILVGALAYACRTLQEPQGWRAYYRSLERIVHRREWRLMQTARQVIAGLKRYERADG